MSISYKFKFSLLSNMIRTQIFIWSSFTFIQSSLIRRLHQPCYLESAMWKKYEINYSFMKFHMMCIRNRSMTRIIIIRILNIPIFIIKKIFYAMQLHDTLPFSSFDVVKLNQLEISHEIGSINLEDPGSISFKLLLRFRVVTFLLCVRT